MERAAIGITREPPADVNRSEAPRARGIKRERSRLFTRPEFRGPTPAPRLRCQSFLIIRLGPEIIAARGAKVPRIQYL